MSDVAVAEKPADNEEKKARKAQNKTLKPSAFSIYGHAFERLTATIPAGYDFEECLKPGFWTNVVQIVKKNIMTGGADRSGSIIEVRTEDHAFYAELYIRAVLERGLIVQCVGPARDSTTGKACPVDLSTGLPWRGAAPGFVAGDLAAKWNPGKKGFDVIRKSDQQVVADGSNLRTREQAEEWIEKTTKAA